VFICQKSLWAVFEDISLHKKEIMKQRSIVNHLQTVFEQIRSEELDRFKRQITAEQNEKIERITQDFIQKILKRPSLRFLDQTQNENQKQLVFQLFSL